MEEAGVSFFATDDKQETFDENMGLPPETKRCLVLPA